MSNTGIATLKINKDDFDETFLHCEVCRSPYVVPVTLPCLHTVCRRPCLDGIIKARGKKQRRFKCPVCRKDTEIPRKGVDGFPKNFYIRSLKEYMERHEDFKQKVPINDAPKNSKAKKVERSALLTWGAHLAACMSHEMFQPLPPSAYIVRI